MGSRIRFTTANQVFEAYPDLRETVTEPGQEVDPSDYANHLLDGPEPLTTLAYFAHVLPKRESVWWGLKCVSGLDAGQSDNDREVLTLSEAWVRDGDEDARLAVHSAAEGSRDDTAAVWIGLAVGWSGGSFSPNPEYRVEAPDDLTAKAVNTAVLIALGTLEPVARQKALKSCVDAGLSFAKGQSMPNINVEGLSNAQALS